MTILSSSSGRILDYQTYLHRQIKQARGRIKLVDVLSGLWIILIGILSYILTVIMLDQAFVLSTTMRAVLLLGFLLATLGFLAAAVVLPALRRINILFAAHELEKAEPSTKNSIINWLLLHHRREEIPESILAAIEKRAANDLSNIKINDAIQTRTFLFGAYVLAAVVVAFCAFLVFTTKDVGTSLQRVLNPFAEIAPPTRTVLKDIQPGTLEGPDSIAAGDQVTISAYATGALPDSVTVYVAVDNDDYWEPVPLQRPDNPHDRWSATLRDRQKSFRYYLTANDFVSPRFRVDVIAAPMITDWKVTYQFPEYTGEPARVDTRGDIHAVEGTQVELEVTTNGKVAEFGNKLDFRLEQGAAKGITVPSIVMQRLAGAAHKLVGRFKLVKEPAAGSGWASTGSYSITFKDDRGRKPAVREVKTIRVDPDFPPEVTFLEPNQPKVDVPRNGVALVRALVKDDFGVRSGRLVVHRQGDVNPLLDRQAGRPGESLGPSHLLLARLDLATIELRPGDLVEYWVEAADIKVPTPNQINTRTGESRFLRIVDPVSPEERNQQQRQADEKLAQQAPPNEPKPGNPPPDGKPDPADPAKTPQDQKPEERLAGGDPNPGANKSPPGAEQSKDQQLARGNDPKPGQENEPDQKLSDEDQKKLRQLEELLGAKDSKPNQADKAADQKTAEPTRGQEQPKDSRDGKSPPPGQGNDSLKRDLEPGARQQQEAGAKSERDAGQAAPNQPKAEAKEPAGGQKSQPGQPSESPKNKPDAAPRETKSSAEPGKSEEAVRPSETQEAKSEGNRAKSPPSKSDMKREPGANQPPGTDPKPSEAEKKPAAGEPPSHPQKEANADKKSGDANSASKPSTGEPSKSQPRESDGAAEKTPPKSAPSEGAAKPDAQPAGGNKKTGDPKSGGSNAKNQAKNDAGQSSGADKVAGAQTQKQDAAQPKDGKAEPAQAQSKPGAKSKAGDVNSEGKSKGDAAKEPEKKPGAGANEPAGGGAQKTSADPKGGSDTKTDAKQSGKPRNTAEQNTPDGKPGRQEDASRESAKQGTDSSAKPGQQKPGSQSQDSDPKSQKSDGKPAADAAPANQPPGKPGEQSAPRDATKGEPKASKSAAGQPNQPDQQRTSTDQKLEKDQAKSGDQKPDHRAPPEGGKPDPNKAPGQAGERSDDPSKEDKQEAPAKTGEPSKPPAKTERKSGSPMTSPEQSPPQKTSKEPGESAASKNEPNKGEGKSPMSGAGKSPSKGDQGKEEGKGQGQGEGKSQGQPGQDSKPGKEQGQGQGDAERGQQGQGQGKSQGDGQGQGKGQRGGQGQGQESSQGKGQDGRDPGPDQGQGQQNQGPGEGQGKSGGQQSGQQGSPSGAGKGSGDGSSKPGDQPGAGSSINGGGGRTGKAPGQDGKAGPPGKEVDHLNPKGNASDLAKGHELTLKKLEDQLKNKKLDPEVLKKIGWTEADARKFLERVRASEASKAEKPADPLRNRGEYAKQAGIRRSTGRRAGSTAQDKEQNLFQDRRVAVPPEYRERFEAYNKSLSQLGARPAQQPANSVPPSNPSGRETTPPTDPTPRR